MLELVVIVCLISNPTECEEVKMQPKTEVEMLSCINMSARLTAMYSVSEKFKVKSVTCRPASTVV